MLCFVFLTLTEHHLVSAFKEKCLTQPFAPSLSHSLEFPQHRGSQAVACRLKTPSQWPLPRGGSRTTSEQEFCNTHQSHGSVVTKQQQQWIQQHGDVGPFTQSRSPTRPPCSLAPGLLLRSSACLYSRTSKRRHDNDPGKIGNTEASSSQHRVTDCSYRCLFILFPHLKHILGVQGVIVDDPKMSSSIKDHQLISILLAEGRKSRIHPKYPF